MSAAKATVYNAFFCDLYSNSQAQEKSGTFRISRLAQLNRADQPAVDRFYSAEESWKFGVSPIFHSFSGTHGKQVPSGGRDLLGFIQGAQSE
jgi:hypothetical protein